MQNIVIASFVSLALVMPSAAVFAGERQSRSDFARSRQSPEYFRNHQSDNNRYRSDHRQYGRHDSGYVSRNWSGYGSRYGYSAPERYNNRYRSSWSGGYGSGFGNNYYSNYGYNGRGRNNWSSTDTVVLGVGLGVLGLALATQSGSAKNRSTDYDNHSWSNRDQVYRASPPVGYEEPDYDPALPSAVNLVDSSCQQTREYQTTIKVGGETVRAYGTACLQPDGSWRKGPPTVEPR
jgi:hypothetical protein